MAFGDEEVKARGGGMAAAGTKQKHEEGGEKKVALRRDRVYV